MNSNPTRLVSVRPAGQDDDAFVHALFHRLHTFNAGLNPRFALAEDWEAVLTDHLSHERRHRHGATFLAWSGECPAGLLMMDGHTDSPLFLHRHWAEIVALYVVPEFRGEGIASELIDAGVTWAGQNGYERIQLHVTSTNVGAKRFYEHSGFAPLQEIWCRDLSDISGDPVIDLVCETMYAHGHYLLSNNQHHLTIDDQTCEEVSLPDDPALEP